MGSARSHLLLHNYCDGKAKCKSFVRAMIGLLLERLSETFFIYTVVKHFKLPLIREHAVVKTGGKWLFEALMCFSDFYMIKNSCN